MNTVFCLVISVGLGCTSASAGLPLLWRIQLQARSTNAAHVATFNLPAGATITNQSAAISEDGFAAIHFMIPSTAGTQGFFVGKDGVGSTPIIDNSGSGFSPSDLDFNFGLLTCISQSSPGSVSLRSAINGMQPRTFNAPNMEDIRSYSRTRMLDGGNAIGYRGIASVGTHKWIIDSFSGTSRIQTVYLSDGPETIYSFLYPPTTNALGHMGGKIDDLNGNATIVRADSPSSFTTIFDGTMPDVDFVAGATDLNDRDQVAFFVRFITGATTRYSLLRSDGVTSRTIASAGDLGLLSADMANFPPAINNDGLVAFRAKDGAGEALFIGDGTHLVRIIGQNDNVTTDLGTMQVGFNGAAISGSLDMNTAGHIAFGAALSNGCTGLFIAIPCYADFNDDLIVDFFDYLDFVASFSTGDSAADFNRDGIVDFFDYLDFVASFANGC